jgi:short-subunit dehydrogenase
MPTDRPVVVLTGASSGIGRATALAFAREGATLVLASRHRPALDEVAQACRSYGARAQVVVTDVTRAEDVRALCDDALAAHGRIDVWINMVGVGAVGAFVDVPIDVHRRVLEANLLGHVYGAHVALDHFVERGRGTLIQMSSLGAWAATPYAAAYTASKFALRGFSRALRGEVAFWPDIHVCDVYPGFVDAPGVQHGASYTGTRVKPAPPLIDPRRVAHVIVRLTRRPRATTMIGAVTRAARASHAIAPELSTRITARLAERAMERADPAPMREGNLFASAPPYAIDGGWRRRGAVGVGTVLAASSLVLGGALLAWRARRS